MWCYHNSYIVVLELCYITLYQHKDNILMEDHYYVNGNISIISEFHNIWNSDTSGILIYQNSDMSKFCYPVQFKYARIPIYFNSNVTNSDSSECQNAKTLKFKYVRKYDTFDMCHFDMPEITIQWKFCYVSIAVRLNCNTSEISNMLEIVRCENFDTSILSKNAIYWLCEYFKKLIYWDFNNCGTLEISVCLKLWYVSIVVHPDFKYLWIPICEKFWYIRILIIPECWQFYYIGIPVILICHKFQ